MPTEVREHEERGHTFRTGVLLYLACIAVCAIFFSLGFLVGFNERGSHQTPITEVVTPPPVIPPAINTPPDGGQVVPQDPSGGHSAPDVTPDTEIIPPGGAAATPAPPTAKRAETVPPKEHPQPTPEPAPSSPPALGPGEAGEGITLQVAALRTKQDAEALVDILKARDYPVFMVTPEFAHTGDNLYRVQVGPFRTRADADKVRDKLVGEGFKPFIKH